MRNNEGVIVNGSGQIHAVNLATGEGAAINYTQSDSSFDREKVSEQLSHLRNELAARAQTSDQYIAIGKVAEAEKAAKDGDKSSVLKQLKAAGAWVLDVAKEIGVDVITDLLKKSI